jgi:hypothetical protein
MGSLLRLGYHYKFSFLVAYISILLVFGVYIFYHHMIFLDECNYVSIILVGLLVFGFVTSRR